MIIRTTILATNFAITLAIVFLASCVSDGGSGAAKRSGGASSSSASGADDARRAGGGRSLTQMALAERSARPQMRAVPIPPGVEPDALTLRATDDPRARLPLDAALAQVAPPAPQTTQIDSDGDAGNNVSEISAEQQAAALKAYARGRNAALDNRHLQAVIEFQKALAIDPNAPQVLREIARSYDASGNQQRAYEMLERLVRVAPDDVDALYALGVAATARREFDRSANYLGRLLRQLDADARERGMDVIVDYTLATSLRELGYDRAFIELARRVADMSPRLAAAAPTSRVASVYRQRGDLLRMAGDAHARLGEYEQAIDLWNSAGSLPSGDPLSLHPRLIYGHLRLGRVYSAQAVVLDSLQRAAANRAPVSERDVQFCSYLAQHGQPVESLARAMLELYEQHPEYGGLVRAAAMLLPGERALSLLRTFIERQPDDLQTLRQLLMWLGRDEQEGEHAAALLTLALIEARPERADAFADALAQSMPGFAAARRAVESLPTTAPESAMQSRSDQGRNHWGAARAALLTRVLMRSGMLGRAWTECQRALAQWPDDRALRLRAVELAAAMQEPALLNRAIAACVDMRDAAALITLSQARRALGQTIAAVEFARQAESAAPEDFDAHVELARAQYAHATVLATDQATQMQARVFTQNAVASANRAIDIQPARDEPFEVLAMIYGPNGVLADGQEFRETVMRLRQANPNSALLNRLLAQDAMTQRRFDQALERLIGAYDSNPADTAALTLAVTAWERSGGDGLERAEAWLREKLEQRPGDAALREQLLRVMFLRKQEFAAITELETQVQSDPDDWTAVRLLESAYRLTGQSDSALRLGEQRLLERPLGVRREIELAGMYVAAERADKALAALDRVRDLAADASIDDLATALVLAGRIQGADAQRDELALDLAHIAIERESGVPLQIYGFALRAIALREMRTGERDERFDQLVREAVSKARGAQDTSFVGARLWQELAQALVTENLTAAAARVLRVRLAEEPRFDDAAFGALARVVIVIDAETAYQAGAMNMQAASENASRTVDTLRMLQDRSLLHRAFEMQGQMDLATALYEASVIYTLVGAEAGSEALMREALRIRPEDAMTLNNLGYMLLERGESSEEVVRLIHEAGRLEPDEANILDTVGWLRYKQNRLADDEGAEPNAGDMRAGAVTLIQRALDVSPDPSPEVWDHLGDARWRIGDHDGATQAWRRAVNMLDDGSFRERLIQNVAILQARQWGIIVMDGQRMYAREYEPILVRAREKLAAAARGQQPVLAAQWGDADDPRDEDASR